MTPEQQAQLFAELLELSEPERERLLKERCANEAERAEFRSLLACDDPEGTRLSAVIASEVEEWTAKEEPRQIGRFQVEDVLGRGGAGVVYRVRFEEEGHNRQAALKVLTLPAFDGEERRRWERERKVLSQLSHPYIAALLESGITPEDQPYLLMEYVEGRRIDDFAADLDARAKVVLMLKVGEAVASAHRQLIVHRDLKPGNILVRADGLPKLLDFGIAHFLEPDRELTAPGWSSLTLAYASPEQVEGKPQTTATDIYSLGAVLHRMLSGRMPFEGKGGLELARAIVEEGPAALPAEVPADLRAVVERAMHRDPAKRYESVGALAADLKRWLDGYPVQARPDSFFYRASRFLRRNWAASAAAGAALLAVLAAAAIAIQQGREAQMRFREVRELAHVALFDFDDAIRDLPGATAARRLVLENALRYLQSLEAAARTDASLRGELADAHQRVAGLQMSGSGQNLNQIDRALENYEKAWRLREDLGHGASRDGKIRARYVAVLTRLAALYRVRLRIADSERMLPLARAASDRWLAEAPQSKDALMAAVYAGDEETRRARRTSMEQALESQQRVLEIVERLREAAGKDLETLKIVADQYRTMGSLLSDAPEPERCMRAHRAGLEAARALAAGRRSVSATRTLLYNLNDAVSSFAKLHPLPLEEARSLAEEAERVLHDGRALEPEGAFWDQHAITLQVTWGKLEMAAGREAEARARLQGAISALDRVLADGKPNIWAAVERARAMQLLR